MTQSVTNNLNNLEQMLSTQSSMQKVKEDVTSAMDKTKDFTKVFESTLNKEVSTIEDVKLKISEISEDKINLENNTIASVEFKEILQKATEEANIETSLDLTLARDINEIISQLKEAVENATEIIEEGSEDEEVAIVVDEQVNDEEELDVELENDEQVIAQDSDKQEQEFQFEQLLTFIDKSLITKAEAKTEVKTELEPPDKDDLNLVQEQIELTSDEVVEVAENIVDEAANLKSPENNASVDIELPLDEEIVKDLKIESISADANTSNGESLMQNQSPEEYAVKAMINQELESFEVKIDSAQSSQANTNVQMKATDVSPSRILDQIAKQLDGLQNNSKVNIVLNPESLGKVNIQLLSSKEGLTAQFTVTTQEARDMLTKGLDGLKEALGTQGVTVDNVSVKVADSQKSEYKQEWTDQEGSRGGNKGQGQPNREEKEKGLFEKMMAQTTEEENGNV